SRRGSLRSSKYGSGLGNILVISANCQFYTSCPVNGEIARLPWDDINKPCYPVAILLKMRGFI
ncbi:MAG: hypothetical protein M0R47_19665, partial [Methylobacter sp.]|uniref:hypothetical protein n=1 Tax=Methylobacter sp. TaxID=2051955 RepID=UPI0025E7A4BA